jgi:hypothetical protein
MVKPPGSDLLNQFPFLAPRFEIFLRPALGARKTLSSERVDGWWATPDIIPRNRKNQRITVDGASYRVQETLAVKQEYVDNVLREGIIWDLNDDPDPSAPAYPREFEPPPRRRSS